MEDSQRLHNQHLTQKYVLLSLGRSVKEVLKLQSGLKLKVGKLNSCGLGIGILATIHTWAKL